jgi:hypothetical protein
MAVCESAQAQEEDRHHFRPLGTNSRLPESADSMLEERTVLWRSTRATEAEADSSLQHLIRALLKGGARPVLAFVQQRNQAA